MSVQTHDLAIGRDRLIGHLAMILFASLIAGSFSLGALTTPYIGAAALNSVRFLIGAAIMLGFSLAVARSQLRWPVAPWRFAVLGALMAVYFVTMFIALQFTHPVATGAMFTLIPLMSAGFGLVFLGQKPSGIVMVSLVIAGLGAVWVIFRGDIDAILGFDIGKGEMIFFFGCVGHAAYAPLVRKFRRGEPLVVMSFWTLLSIAVWVTLYGAGEIMATDWAAIPLFVWACIAYLAIFATAGTFFLLQLGSVRLPAAKVLAYGYLTPSFVILIEGLSGRGWVSPAVIMGSLVSAVGLFILFFTKDQ
ncbi:DMT family transporter [Cucumibacter marinus]|uniref:DMT family transporter n=1 Tax=Cucumibacter marinus TaxID=1121252 RepID=UPI000427C783|nr:DMT family transporter [Cucumibacter marinus]